MPQAKTAAHDHVPTDRSLPIALLRAREAVMVPIRQMLAESGINEQKWRVLRVLQESGPMEQTTLAARACLLLPSLTRILSTLQQDGYLTRAADQKDRRKSIVTLSERGRAFVRDHAAAGQAVLASFEAKLGKDRMEILLQLLDELQHIND